jgi:hypothetical protein
MNASQNRQVRSRDIHKYILIEDIKLAISKYALEGIIKT